MERTEMLKRMGAKAALAGLGTLIATMAFAAPSIAAETVFGLTSNDRITTFASDKPGAVTPSLPIIDAATNLPITADVIGIDFRPATKRLYGIIKPTASTAQAVQLVFNPTNNIFVAARAPDPAAPTPPQPLDGSVYGIDFNPLADRLRVHSTENDNARFNPTTGAVTTDPDLVFSDAVGDPAVTGTAYSKNQPGTTSTQLYGIDVGEDRVVTMQSPSPTFETVTRRGPLGVDATGDVGFDISPRGDALASIEVSGSGGQRRLFRIDLDQPSGSTQPSAEDLGVISRAVRSSDPTMSDPVVDITVQPNVRLFAALRPPASPGGAQLLSLFRGDLPEGLSAARPITFLGTPTTLLGIDVRQADGQLYAIGEDEFLYRLSYDSRSTEVPAELVGRIPTPTVFSGSFFGVDFNPVADRLRVISDTDQNLRINPTTPGTAEAGTVAGADTPITPGTRDIVGVAYDNPFFSADTTTLFGIDSSPLAPGGTLVTVGGPEGTPSPDTGVTTPVANVASGSLGTFTSPSGRTGYDIIRDDNLGYMATDNDGAPAESVLYTIGGGNFSSEAIPVGKLGGGGTLVDGLSAVNDDVFQLGSVSGLVTEDTPLYPIFITRAGPADVPAQVKVSLMSLTATGGFDFGPVQQTNPATGALFQDPIVRFSPGETTKTVLIPIINDTNVESSEAFFVDLLPPDAPGTSLNGARIGFPHQMTVVIGDDEAPVTPPSTGGGGGGGTTVITGRTVTGTAGNDTLNGTPGDDLIICGEGDDVVNAGGGNDTIICGGGNDEINGGAGDDGIDAGAGSDRVNGGTGDDVILARVNGGTGDDVILARTGADRINGGSGNDRIGGGSGNDRISGSTGRDRLNGEGGNDSVSTGGGDDRASGGSGNDRLSGSTGNDRLSGNSGRDSLGGGSGDDRLSGGSGNDRLTGNSGDDRLSGQSGRDRLRGGSGRDRLSGGAGRDVSIQ